VGDKIAGIKDLEVVRRQCGTVFQMSWLGGVRRQARKDWTRQGWTQNRSRPLQLEKDSVREFYDGDGDGLDDLESGLDCPNVVALVPLAMIYEKHVQQAVFVG